MEEITPNSNLGVNVPASQPKKPFNTRLVLVLAGVAILVGAGIFAAMYPWGASKVDNIVISQTPMQTLTSTPPTSQTADETAGWQTYRNYEYMFEIKYPKGWSADEFQGQDGVVFSSSRFGPVVRIFAKAGKMIDEVNKLKDEVKRDGWAGVGSEREIGIAGLSGKQLVVHWRQAGGRSVAHYFVGNNAGNIYQITQELGQVDQDTFDKVLSTFQFIAAGDTTDWQTYRNEKYGFEVKIPNTWPKFNIRERSVDEAAVAGGIKLLEFGFLTNSKKWPAENGFAYIWGLLVLTPDQYIKYSDPRDGSKPEIFKRNENNIFAISRGNGGYPEDLENQKSGIVFSTFKFTK